MFRGTVVTVRKNGLQVSDSKLEPIGIFHKSQCWGVEVPDWPKGFETANREDSGPIRQLLISPISFESWPACFRVEFVVERSAEATAAVLEVLTRPKYRLNILAIERYPHGHSHAIINIVAEALNLKEDPILDAARRIADKDRHYYSPDVWKFAHKELAAKMLSFANSFVNGVLIDQDIMAHLRDSRHEKKRGFHINPEEIESSLKDFATEQSFRPVKCTWLHFLSFLWLFTPRDSKAASSPTPTTFSKTIPFRYNAYDSLLEPTDDGARAAYSELIKQDEDITLPYRALASIDTNEQYLRFTFSPYDKPQGTASVSIDYDISFEKEENNDVETSIGFQCEIVEKLRDGKFLPRQISKAIIALSDDSEHGKISMLVSRSEETRKMDDSSFDEIERRVGHGESFENRNFRKYDCHVKPFTADLIFISTRFEWLTSNEKLLKGIPDLIEQHGFTPVIARDDWLTRHQPWLVRPGENIDKTVDRLLGISSGFLQIYPSFSKSRMKRISWLSFELGLAYAKEIPIKLCLDDKFVKVMKGEEGIISSIIQAREYHSWKVRSRPNRILDKIEEAVTALNNLIREHKR